MTVMTLTERDDGQRITASVGDTVDIRLAENATTGYRWTLEPPATEVLVLSDAGADYPGGDLGSAGEAHFRLTVSVPGTAVLRLVYGRRWEGEAGISRTFSVEVAVTPA